MREAVDELRDRLYRPAPPPGAVAAYLDAVRTAETARQHRLPTRTTAPLPGRGRRAVGAALLVAASAVLAPAVVAAVTGSPPAVHAADVRVEPSAGGTAAQGPGWPPVTGVPIGRLRGDGHAGSARFSAGGLHAVVSVNCIGEGTFTVRIGPEDPVVLVCDRGAVAFALVASRTALHRFRLEVAADAPVRWTLAVGAIDLPTA